MGRLSLVALVPCALLACDGKSAQPEAGGSRVVAVMAERPTEKTLEAFCDVRKPAAQAPAFRAPPFADAAGTLPSSGWRWINVWATWCRPCVEEMPMLGEWQRRLASDGKPITLAFISADGAAEDVDRFRREHPSIPASQRISEPAGLPAWAALMGLDEGATLPIHMFVDPSNKVRCVRTGAVNPTDYETVKYLLAN